MVVSADDRRKMLAIACDNCGKRETLDPYMNLENPLAGDADGYAHQIRVGKSDYCTDCVRAMRRALKTRIPPAPSTNAENDDAAGGA